MSSKENPESYDENDDSPIEIDELEEVAKIKLYSGNIWSITIRRFVRNKSSLIGLFLLIFIIVIPAFFAETLTNTFDFVYADTVRFQTYIPFYQPPGYHTEANGTVNFHLLGTDNLGKDVFTVLIYGARISLVVGVVSTILSMVIGIPVGLISGYFGGMVDELLMKLTDLFLTFPFYFVMIVFIITIQGNLQLSLFLDSVNLTDSVNIAAIVIGLGLFGWSGTARVVRAEVFKLRDTTFVEAAISLGTSTRTILTKHIIPNVLPPLIVIATFSTATNILVEAALAFLGFSNPGTSSWGREISDGQLIFSVAPWISIFSGLAIILGVMSFNLLGDGLRDATDPRLKR